MKGSRKQVKPSRQENITGLVMAGIPIVGFLVFTLVPMLLAFGTAFFDLHELYSFQEAEWEGLLNFKEVLTDPIFWRSVGNTIYMAVGLPVNIFLSLLIAYLLTKNIKGKKVYRCIYFIPYVCSTVAVSLMWSWIFNRQYGVVNTLLGMAGENGFDWFGPNMFIPTLVLTGIWSGLGFNIILYSAALTSIDTSLYEAARIDGASAVQVFTKVTFPLVSPTTFYLVTISIIGALQEFARPQVLAGADIRGKTIVLYLWEKAFEYPFDMGAAAATSWVLALIILGVTAINFSLRKKWVMSDE